MDSFYAPGRLLRWEPAGGLPELPMSSFDLAWSSGRTLICSGFYSLTPEQEFQGLILEFENVHAFAVFDRFSDVLLNHSEHLIPLKELVPYGGSWPFVEVEESRWVKGIVDEHGGMPYTQNFTHWSVITYDQTLHVMAPKDCMPALKGMIR